MSIFKDIRSISIDLTESCNLKCDYCFTYSKHDRKVIDTDLAKTIINDFITQSKHKHLGITWWGGEPLLEYEKMQELTKYAQDKARENNKTVKFDITTNGTLVTEEKNKWFKDNNFVILFSYDGVEQAHDVCRKFKNDTGSWKTVNKNIKQAKENNLNVSIRLSIGLKNYKYLFESIKHIVEDLGFTGMAFSPIYEDNWTDCDLKLLEEQMNKIIDYVVDTQEKHNKYIDVSHFTTGLKMAHSNVMSKQPSNFLCGAGSSFIGISVDGVIFPCHRFNKHGITFEERLKEPNIYGAYINNKFQEIKNTNIRESILDINKDENYDSIAKKLNHKIDEMNYAGCCYATNYDLTNDIFKTTEFGYKYEKIMVDASKKLLLSFINKNLTISSVEVKTANSNNICVEDYKPATCECYQARYSNTSELLNKFLDLSKRILLNRNEPKTEEQSKLEEEVLQKTIDMLGK